MTRSTAINPLEDLIGSLALAHAKLKDAVIAHHMGPGHRMSIITYSHDSMRDTVSCECGFKVDVEMIYSGNDYTVTATAHDTPVD